MNERLLPQDGFIVAGLSGGADSAALVHWLYQQSKERDFRVIAVHLNHGLRESATADETFCVCFCEKLGIPLEVRRVNCLEYAKSNGLTVEEAGRELRRAAFLEIAGESGLIATGHTQNDQAETIIMRLIRGTGLLGLGGMKEQDGRFIKPLLHVTRAQTEAYCRTFDIPFIVDETNCSADYFRNRVRHQILPVLELENPEINRVLVRMAGLLAQDENYLADITKKTFEELSEPTDGGVLLDISGLSTLHPAIRSRVLRLPLGQDISALHVDSIWDISNGQTGRRMNLPGGIIAEKRYNKLYIGQSPQTVTMREIPVYGEPDLIIRNRRPGDFINLPGVGRKKLKDFLIDKKVPRNMRDNLRLVARESEVLWISGIYEPKGLSFQIEEDNSEGTD